MTFCSLLCAAMCFQPLNYLNLLKSQISSNCLQIRTLPHYTWSIPIWKLHWGRAFNVIILTNKIHFLFSLSVHPAKRTLHTSNVKQSFSVIKENEENTLDWNALGLTRQSLLKLHFFLNCPIHCKIDLNVSSSC